MKHSHLFLFVACFILSLVLVAYKQGFLAGCIFMKSAENFREYFK